MPKSDKRPLKGKSLLKFPTDYTLVDIETTGLDPRYDSIIEIGAIKVRDNKITEQFSSLVNPQRLIDDFISELTGITNLELKNAPVISEVIPFFMDFTYGEIIVGHNVNFDINFLYDNMMKQLDLPLSNDFVCTLRLSRWLFKDLHSHSMKSLINEFNLPERTQHRAVADCQYTKDLLDYMNGYVISNNLDLSEVFQKTTSAYRSKAADLREISADTDDFDMSHPLYGQNIVFTGVLERMLRKEAAQLAANLGALCQNGVNKSTNILVLGNNDYNPLIKGGMSSKQKKAQEYILKGQDLIIISENVFYDMVTD